VYNYFLQLSLNGGEYESFSRVDGSFTFHDVKPGIYLLDVLSEVAMFSQVTFKNNKIIRKIKIKIEFILDMCTLLIDI
jgi:hypothetical protein